LHSSSESTPAQLAPDFRISHELILVNVRYLSEEYGREGCILYSCTSEIVRWYSRKRRSKKFRSSVAHVFSLPSSGTLLKQRVALIPKGHGRLAAQLPGSRFRCCPSRKPATRVAALPIFGPSGYVRRRSACPSVVRCFRLSGWKHFEASLSNVLFSTLVADVGLG
jgi:hypothetical protein